MSKTKEGYDRNPSKFDVAIAAAAKRGGLKDENGEPMIDRLKFEECMREMAMEEVTKAAENIGFIADQQKKAAEILQEEMKAIGYAINTVEADKKKMVTLVRDLRMTVNREVSQALSSFKDIRAFFLGPDHETQTARLKEFVDLCERLQVLKDSGFLDSVADTILKLDD